MFVPRVIASVVRLLIRVCVSDACYTLMTLLYSPRRRTDVPRFHL